MNIGSPTTQGVVTATPDSPVFDDDEDFASRRHKDVWSDEENEY